VVGVVVVGVVVVGVVVVGVVVVGVMGELSCRWCRRWGVRLGSVTPPTVGTAGGPQQRADA